jgi:hypothetical protein
VTKKGDFERKTQLCNWLFRQDITVFLKQNLKKFVILESCFHMSEYTHVQISKYKESINPRNALEMLLYDHKIDVRCATTDTRAVEIMLLLALLIQSADSDIHRPLLRVLRKK